MHLSAAGVCCEKNGKASSNTILVRLSLVQGDNCSLFSHGVDLLDLAVTLKSLAAWTLLHCSVGTSGQGSRKKQAWRPGSNSGREKFSLEIIQEG